MRKKKTETPAVVKTIAGVAKRLGVSERVAAGWLAAGAPGSPGQYDCGAIAAWRAANKRPARNTAGNDKWERRRRRAAALLEELKLKQKRGDLILVSRAAQVIRQHVAEVVTHLDQLPDFAVAGQRLPAEAKKKVRERLKGRIREMRLTLEKSLKEMARTAKRDGEAESEE